MTHLDRIWWHVYPLGAAGAPIRDRAPDDSGHRLARLEGWLDYVVDLGCTGLLLGPVFASGTHGYDTLDHFRLDPRLGDDAAWDRFAAAAAQRGLAIVLDGVFNHVGAQHPAVRESLDAGHGLVRVRHHDGGRSAATWEGHGDLAELDHDNPAVADLVTDVMCHWLDRGAAGWRLDVAYAVPTGFWAHVLGRVRARHPEALFIGEVIHGDYAAIAAASTLDSLTQYELWKAIWSSINDRNMWELAAALERHERFSRGSQGSEGSQGSQAAVMQTFVGNHDVTRIASRVGDAGAALAATTLLTLPGMPSVYYGDEQAFRGEKGRGFEADDALRPALPDSPGELAPYGWWLHDLYRDLIALRRRNPWLTRGAVRVTAKDNGRITYAVTSVDASAGSGRELAVEVRVAPVASARVWLDGVEVFAWSAALAA